MLIIVGCKVGVLVDCETGIGTFTEIEGDCKMPAADETDEFDALIDADKGSERKVSTEESMRATIEGDD